MARRGHFCENRDASHSSVIDKYFDNACVSVNISVSCA